MGLETIRLPATAENIAKADASLLYGAGKHYIDNDTRERGTRRAQRLYHDRAGRPYVNRFGRRYRRYVEAVTVTAIDGRVLETTYALVLGERRAANALEKVQ